MKLQDAVAWAKLGSLVVGTSLTTLQVGLGQWSNDASMPSYIQWTMIIGGSIGTGLLAGYGAMSGSFPNYVGRTTNGIGAAPPPPATPPGP